MSSYLSLSDQTLIRYQSFGKGQTIVLVPGWCCPSDIFAKNLGAFVAANYRVLTFDPRGHGYSDISENGNNYIQHGEDLGEILTQLNIERPILLGWTLGLHTIYAYLKEFGLNDVKAVIAVDQCPNIIKSSDDDWGEGNGLEIEGLFDLIESEQFLHFYRDYIEGGFIDSPDLEMVEKFTAYAARMTPQMAASLIRSSADTDYSDIARQAAEKLPFLTIVREDWADEAQAWVKANQAKSTFHVLGAHLMLYEYPYQFNTLVLDFLKQLDN